VLEEEVAPLLAPEEIPGHEHRRSQGALLALSERALWVPGLRVELARLACGR
jgi:hypothetical protein